MKRAFFFSDSQRPSFNLALEEVFFRNLPELGLDGLIYFYVNQPSLIIGRSQNAFREIDWLGAEQWGLPILRRLSGGGAVYHDLNNLNFSFIVKRQENLIINFQAFLEPVIAYLQSLHIAAELSGPSDLRVDGKKISGNAQALDKEVILEHGTLLFDSELTVLGTMLHHRQDGLISRSVESNQADVANLSDYLEAPMSFEAFAQGLSDFLQSEQESLPLTRHETLLEKAAELEKSRYLTRAWNMERCAKFSLKRQWRGWDFSLLVERGSISEMTCVKTGDSPNDSLNQLSASEAATICRSLQSVQLYGPDLRAALSFLEEVTAASLITSLFRPTTLV